MTARALLAFACLLPAAARAAPQRLPSLAKINGLLDQARDMERKGDFASVLPHYAGVLAECGDPAPRHLRHVAAKAYVHSGNAHLALGRLDEAEAAYREAVTRWGSAYETEIRQHVLRARALTGRIAEIRKLSGVPPPRPVSTTATTNETNATAPAGPEPLLLLTERETGGGGNGGARGYVVQAFDGDEAALALRAEGRASPTGRKVLVTGREMAVAKQEILPGSCWDYIHAVFNRAGFAEKKRKVVCKCSKQGPYLDVAQIQPGDWLYYRNLSYGRIEHSGIFVDWIQPASKVALILSYPGQGRAEPARYRPYDLSGVYRVTRPASI